MNTKQKLLMKSKYTYDRQGNMLSDGSRRYLYDAINHFEEDVIEGSIQKTGMMEKNSDLNLKKMEGL